MHIRLAGADDVPAILAISNRAAAETAANFAIAPESLASWRESFRATRDTHPWLVAADGGGAIVGFAKASPWKGRCAYAYGCEITVYVDPASHGRGIGRALYERLFAVLAAQGYRTVIAGITLPNPASVRLHESFGLKHVGTFERIGWKFGRWHDVSLWQGHLGDPAAAAAPPAAALRTVREAWTDTERPA